MRLVSDEIYHGITYGPAEPGPSSPAATTGPPAPVCLAHLTHRGGVRFVLQVLLDDRLAARLDAGARGPAQTGRRAHGELHDLSPGAQPVRRDRRLHARVLCRARRSRGEVCDQPGAVARSAAAAGDRPAGSGGRRLLRVRRHRPPHRRLLRVVPGPARRHRRGHRARHRLRHQPWQRVRAVLLRGQRGRDHRRARSPGELARVSAVGRTGRS